jgi:hypothetical protein
MNSRVFGFFRMLLVVIFLSFVLLTQLSLKICIE